MDIPLIGFLFRDTSTSLQKKNLFLFVTPSIMSDLKTFSDYHKITWEKKLQQDKLFGEEVDLLGTKFLGPDVPRSAQEAVLRIEGSGILDAYRYKGEPSESERLDAARRAWERSRGDEEPAEPAEPMPPPEPDVPPPESPAPAPVEEPKQE
jgi:general secretion pathway protein D